MMLIPNLRIIVAVAGGAVEELLLQKQQGRPPKRGAASYCGNVRELSG